MASTREIRRRIRSISSTAQITKAMQMVAASKMRKAQEAAIEIRPFVRMLYRIQRIATTRDSSFTHPLLEVREVKKRAIILVASDKGLCGALNSNVFRLAGTIRPGVNPVHRRRPEGRAVRRPHPPAARRRVSVRRHAALSPSRGRLPSLARDLFLKGEVDEVQLVATQFVNTLVQQPVVVDFLPVGDIRSVQIPAGAAARRRGRRPPGVPVRAERRRHHRVSARTLSQRHRPPRAGQCESERTERAHGVDEERHRQRGHADQGPEARLQQAAAGSHHAGTARNRRRPGHVEPPQGMDMNTGTIVQVVGPVVDVAFLGRAPRDLERVDGRIHGRGSTGDAHARSAAAPGRPVGARDFDVRH